MVKIRKYANGIERFLHGEKGQRFFNFAYSIGAAIVIWGALFKILHLPGGNTLLCIGMGTEVAMFILTAFDRPPKEYSWEEVFPVLDSKNPDDRPNFAEGSVIVGTVGTAGQVGQIESAGFPGLVGQLPGMPTFTADYVEKMQSLSEQMDRPRKDHSRPQRGKRTSSKRLQQHRWEFDEIAGNSTGYADRMADLNRNIAGLNTIYEIQLKSVSGQLETIDRVNKSMKDIRDMYEKSAHESSRYCEETEKMARYMRQLNAVYEKMITGHDHQHAEPYDGKPVRRGRKGVSFKLQVLSIKY